LTLSLNYSIHTVTATCSAAGTSSDELVAVRAWLSVNIIWNVVVRVRVNPTIDRILIIVDIHSDTRAGRRTVVDTLLNGGERQRRWRCTDHRGVTSCLILSVAARWPCRQCENTGNELQTT